MTRLFPALLLLAVACGDKDPTGDSGPSTTPDSGDGGTDPYDQDGDGYKVGDDCNDLDAAVNPGATEVCNDLDDDCDGLVDDDDDSLDASTTTTQYQDGDRDGYGDPDDVVATCELDNSRVDNDGDCDDNDPDISPEADEDCFTDGADLDCDGLSGCADDDCAVCPEDCSDGTDNDDDGLTDCEDGDCLGQASCDEVCDDGSDNDADGLTDCEDDACWGEAGCEVVLAAVSGGTWSYYRRERTDEWLRASDSTSIASLRERASASYVSGSALRVTASGTAACSWFVGRMTASYSAVSTYGVGSSVHGDGLPSRIGFATSGACGGLGSSILPATLYLDPAGAHAPWGDGAIEWYEPALSFRTSFSTSTTYATGTATTVRFVSSSGTSAGGTLTPASSFVTVIE